MAIDPVANFSGKLEKRERVSTRRLLRDDQTMRLRTTLRSLMFHSVSFYGDVDSAGAQPLPSAL